jgi:hypothetical protein
MVANKLGQVKQAHVAADVEEGLKIGAVRWLKQRRRPHVMCPITMPFQVFGLVLSPVS